MFIGTPCKMEWKRKNESSLGREGLKERIHCGEGRK